MKGKERAGGRVRMWSAHACEHQRRRRRGSLGDDSGFARWGNGRRRRQGSRRRTARRGFIAAAAARALPSSSGAWSRGEGGEARGRGLRRGLLCALGGGGACRCERSPQPRPAGRRGRWRPWCLAEEASVCVARRRWPGRVRGRRLRLVTSE